MIPIDYDGRRFRGVSNTATGEVSDATVFDYRQQGAVVWATYHGGGVRWGTLVATVDAEGRIDMRYSHVNEAGDLKTGACVSTPERLPDGRLRLHERWRWTSGPGEGRSVVEEVGPGEVG
ncbi:n-acetylglutamate synthase [Rubrivirga sp. IMCC45206]|uniref:n-acetylglutamate synthase n=1 Tax=Rubrivirga sp. IMCC45206 TaxID=3391614 RepID=UPI0039900C4C